MTLSMTGFASMRATGDDQTVRVRIRTVNHKGLKVSVHVPDQLFTLRQGIEGLVQRHCARGSIHVDIMYHAPKPAGHWRLDSEQLKQYYDQIDTVASGIAEQTGRATEAPRLELLASLPGVVCEVGVDEPDGEALSGFVLPVVEQALGELQANRAEEGARLQSHLRSCCEGIRTRVANVEAALPQVLADHRARLAQRLEALTAERGLSEDVVAREMAVVADKSDVCEELARLASHLTALEQTLTASGPVGRKLEFLALELNREATTLGAKISDPMLTQDIVELKLEVERIREQAANVE